MNLYFVHFIYFCNSSTDILPLLLIEVLIINRVMKSVCGSDGWKLGVTALPHQRAIPTLKVQGEVALLRCYNCSCALLLPHVCGPPPSPEPTCEEGDGG